MKQIFDWLREQMEKVKCEVYSPADVVWNNAVKMCLREVDEAEAKWGADCCEWKDTKIGIFHIKTNCGNWIETNYGYKFCPYCGKPIKISEVE